MPGPIQRGLARLAYKADTVRILSQVGMIRPQRPDRLVQAAAALRRWGPTFAGGTTSAAARWPDAPAVIDERVTLTWREVHERSNALARALEREGLRPGDAVAIMCRNHHGMVEATIAAAKLGLTAVFLNAMFAAPEVAAVCKREDVTAIIYDSEFAAEVAAAEGCRRYVAWSDDEHPATHPLLDDLIGDVDGRDLVPPSTSGRIIILTSGTTGVPKGAQRHQPSSLDPIASLFDRIPYRVGERTIVAAPMFHSWGMVNFGFGLSLGSTYVLQRRFDPQQVLAAIEQHRCTALVVVPVMLQRIMALPEDVLNGYDTSSLRIIGASGSPLTGELAREVLDRFGDVLYNFYGSTEVSWVTIAGPADLRAAPGTAGRPPRGTTIKIVDSTGKEAPPGTTGRIFVSNEMIFSGYTNGETRDLLDGLMSTGDVGHVDEEGRLFVDGREDDMIISGGENVFPREIEDVLAGHDAVDEVAVIGVPDADWGQRLRAYVVPRPGAQPDPDELVAYVKERLASYKAPREIVFLEELPRTATGKILRRNLTPQ